MRLFVTDISAYFIFGKKKKNADDPLSPHNLYRLHNNKERLSHMLHCFPMTFGAGCDQEDADVLSAKKLLTHPS